MRILFITAYFSPYSLVGAKRVNSLVKFFLSRGNEIVVFKLENKFYGNFIVNNDPFINYKEKLKRVEVKVPDIKNRNLKILLMYRNYKKTLINYLTKENNFDFAIFSGGPFFYFILGKIIKKKFKIPYILDFRDIWYRHKHYETHGYKGIEKFTDSYLEYQSIKYSDLVIDVTERASKIRKKIYKNFDPEKFVVIHNGYEKVKLEDSNYIPLSGYFKIGIFGKFAYYNKEHIKWLCKIANSFNDIRFVIIGKEESYIKRIINEFKNNELKEEIYIKSSRKLSKNYYVNNKDEKDLLLNKNINKYCLKNFEFLGVMEYNKGLDIMNKMDLLILNNMFKFALGTKIFDYIYLNKPILALIFKDSEIAELLKKFENGYVAETYEEFEQIIKNLKNNRKNKLTENNHIIESFSREKQFEKLYNIILNKINK